MQVIGGLGLDGVGRGTLEIDRALVEQGWGSVVVSSGGRLADEVRGRLVLVRLGGRSWRSRLIGAWRIRRAILEHGVDLVHARNRGPAWPARLAARWTGRPFLTTCHGAWDADTREMRFSAILASGDQVIAVSEFVARHVVRAYGADPARVSVILRGADIDHFDPSTSPAPLGLPAGRPVVMLPGRLVGWKGQHVFAEAMRGLLAQGVIVGDVMDRAYADALRARLPDNVTMLPATNDMPAMLANASVVVSASVRPEAFGRVAVEGQAMGKPVIATNIGGALETVIDGETGRLVPPQDAPAMARAIAGLLADLEADPGRYREACLRNAARLSTRAMCEKEMALYERMLAG